MSDDGSGLFMPTTEDSVGSSLGFVESEKNMDWGNASVVVVVVVIGAIGTEGEETGAGGLVVVVVVAGSKLEYKGGCKN